MKIKNYKFSIFLLTVLLVPLAFNPWGFDMFEIPKNLILKTGISILAIIYLINSLKTGKLTLNLNKLQLKILGAFLIILALSYLVAINPNLSFFGTYFRQGGLINMIFYVLLFLLAINFFQKPKHKLLFLKLLSITGVIISTYAIIQQFGIDIFPTSATEIFEGRSFATLGNPTSLGAFLLFPIWGEIYLFFKQKKHRKKSILTLALLLTALIFTRNRASILALLVTGALALFTHFRKNKKILATLVTTTLAILIIFTAVYADNLRSLGSRLSIWQSSAEIILENPIKGSGLESFSYLFERNVHADFFQYEDYYNLVDRPHNEFLEVWIHLGLLGFLFYLGLFLFCVKKFVTTKEILYLGILSLFITNFFSFSLVTHYTFLAVFLGCALADPKKKTTWELNYQKIGAISAIALLLFLNLALNTRVFLADFNLKKAYTTLDTTYIEKAIYYAPFYTETYQEGYIIYYSLSGALADNNLFARTTQLSAKIREMSRDSLESLLNEIRLHLLLQDYESAEQLFFDIEEAGIINPLVYEYWGNIYFDQADYEKASEIYEKLLSILPDSWQGDGTDYESHIFWKTHPDFLETLEKIILSYEVTGNQL